MQRILKTFLLLIFPYALAAQTGEDFSWWNAIHQWDGHTSWEQYMTISPAFMGPNALPVPDIQNGRLSDEIQVEQLAGYQFSTGDKTTDLFSRVYIPLHQDKVGLEMYVVPIEFFETDTITRDVRAARTRSGKGSAGGDIYFSTHISILKDKSTWPDISLELAFRSASGTRLRDARYTDAAGYFFDLSFGKNIVINKEKEFALRPYFMGGFYSYQTYDIQHLQNDALLYGIGLDFSSKKISIAQQFGGYSGYFNNGDQPMVYRAVFKVKQKHIDYKLWYQWGLHDFPFQGIRAGIIVHGKMNK